LIWIKPAGTGVPNVEDRYRSMGRRMDVGEAPLGARQDWTGEEVIQIAVRLALLALLVFWSFILLRPFISILVLSGVLAVALYPAYDWLSERLKHRPGVAAVIVTLVVLGVFLGPAAWLGFGLVEGLRNIFDKLTSGDLAIPTPPDGINDWPVIGAPLFNFWKTASVNLEAAFRELAPYLKQLAGPILAIAGSAGTGTVKFLASVVLSGFLFPYGPRLVAASRRALTRIVPERSESFLALAGATIRTVLQGVIGVAAFQALLAGIVLKIVGVPNVGTLAFAILVLGIVQIGSLPILLPVVVWIWAVKDVGAAVLITILLVLVGISDNALRPLLMGRGLSTPVLVIFIGVIGGTLAHGIVGLFIGPVILAVAWELMIAWIGEDRLDVNLSDDATAEKV
jgi:predicted PurR-regulated permease PerM